MGNERKILSIQNKELKTGDRIITKKIENIVEKIIDVDIKYAERKIRSHDSDSNISRNEEVEGESDRRSKNQ